MDLNITILGRFLIVNLIIITSRMLKFAKGNTDNLPLVGFYSVLLNSLIVPVGWTIVSIGKIEVAWVTQKLIKLPLEI